LIGLLSEERINPALKNINQHHAMSFFHFLASVKRTLEERRGRRKSINLAIVSANNHYMLVLVQGLPIYSERWLGYQEPHGVRRKMTNHTYTAVITFSRTMVQTRVPSQIL
jgi:predicted glycosyltransferase